MPGASQRTEELIYQLATDLRPVRRLRPPTLRAVIWLGLVALIAGLLFCFYGSDELTGRLAQGIAMPFAMAGSILTAIAAAIAAFQLSLPDRSEAWALLPLPAAALWLGSSGLGCLQFWLIPGLPTPSVATESECFLFVMALSVPLSTVMLLMLRQARPLRPGLVAGTGGLAAAAAAAALLWFFHPFDASVTDVLSQVIVVLGVIALNRAIGGRLLAASAGVVGIRRP